ncbi:MAG: L,D-transpeptidase [Beijerinckiaceae bacterium]
MTRSLARSMFLGAASLALASSLAPSAQAQTMRWATYEVQEPMFLQPYTHAPRGAAPRAQVDSEATRELVEYRTKHRAGTIIISNTERKLYLVNGDGTAWSYGVGIGRPGFSWTGTKTVSRKAEWPDWRPPAEMLKRRPDLPTYMPGGEDNPLGARALYLGSSLYRIHGSNEPETIGQAVSSGCFRMANEDVIDLYARVKVGTRVIVTN